jgi:uncharacterized membrane protein (UPF0182 family)
MISDKVPTQIERFSNINVLMNFLISILQFAFFAGGVIVLVVGISLYISTRIKLKKSINVNNKNKIDELMTKMQKRKNFLRISIIISIILFILTGIMTTQKTM